MRRLLIVLTSFLLVSTALIPTAVGAEPSNVVANTGGAGELVVTWDVSGNGAVVDYLVELDQGGGSIVVPVAQPKTASFSGLTIGQLYQASVTARDVNGDQVGFPAFANGTPIGLPGVPTNVVAVLNGGNVDVTWAAPGSNGGSAITNYVVRVNGGAPQVVGATPRSFSTPAPAPGSSVTVTVAARNAVGDSAATSSNTVSNAAVAPGVPGNVVAVLNGGNVDVTWAAPGSNGGSAITNYVVRVNGGAPQVVGATPRSFSTPAPAPGSSVTVTVAARNAVGDSAATSSNTVSNAAVAPGVPGNVVAVLNGGNVDVTWAAPGSNGGSAITNYVVRVNGGAPQVVGATPRSFSTPAPAPGSSVTVTVAARNAVGDSAATSSNTVSNAAVAPGVPRNVAGVVSGSDVVVTWAAPVSNGGSAITGYVVRVNGGAPQVVGATPRSFTTPAPAPGSSVTVTVAARNAVGDSAAVSTGAVAVPAVGASVPRNVAAALGGPVNDFVTVTWQVPADNGGSAITGYTVSLSNGQSLPAGAGATSVTFETVAAGTAVTARVRAVTAAGNGANSAASNSVTTSNVPGPVTGLSAAWAGESNINSINVSWTAPGVTGGLPLTGYVVDVTPALANPIPVVAAGTTSLVIGGLVQGTSYTVRVRAQNDRGNSAGTTSSAVLVPTTPGTVTDLLVQQSPPFSSGVILTWALPLETGGSPITGYSIVVDERDPLVVGPAVTTASFGDLPVGEHNVTIRAITAAGLGATVTSPNFQVKAFAPFDSEEDFVTQIYADFLRRAPDAGGLAFWTARVADDGSNVQEIIEAFMRSPEFAPRRSVARLYFAYFNRQPDKGGFDFWTRQISTGASVLENASQSFALSPEFIRTYGSLNDAEFIVLVYNNVLARRPDQGGFEFWLAQLSGGMPRGTLMTLFSESPENIPLSRPAVDVTVTYDGLLQRAPDVQGFLFWTGRVSASGTGLTELIRQFYFSLEYADRVNR